MSAYYYPVFEDLNKLDKFQIIIDIVEQAIVPNIPAYNLEWMDVVANGYSQAKQYKKSIEWAEKVLAFAKEPGQKYGTRTNLVQLYITANMPEKALQYAEINLKLNPDDWEMKTQKAVALYALNRKSETREIFFDMMKNKHLYPPKAIQTVEFNLGLHYLTLGKFQEGMSYLALGRKMKIWGADTHKYPIPKWDGEKYEGKSVLIVGEGGIGDEVICARFAKHIRDMGMIPHVASCHNNASMFSRMPFESVRNYTKFTTDISDIKSFDFWAPMMDLPHIMKHLDWKDLWYGPYITVDKKYDEKWKLKLPKSDKLKVGLKWMGNPLYEQQLHRTVPIKEVVDILDLNKYELVSLQKEHATDLDDNPNVKHLNDDLETIEDLVAAIEQLDIVITSCTSIAHIAGAMGKKTYVFVPIMNYYIWAEDGNHSSWYGDNVFLCRQEEPRNWNSSLEQLKANI